MLRVVLLSLLLMSNAIANSPNGERIVIQRAINEIYNTDNHPSADQLPRIVDARDARNTFLEQRKKDRVRDYVIVNIGSQVMTIVENNKAIASQKVIIGRDSRPTPLFEDKLRYIVVNPLWNVPTKLAVEDVFPRLKENPDMIDDDKYQMIDNATGLPVKFNFDANLRNFRIRQDAGPKSVLGGIKYIFDPQPDRNIYFHATPNTELFDYDIRRFSSGSIRVEDPEAFTNYLMKGKALPISNKKDQWIELPEPVNVYIVDWPVYVDLDGEIVVDAFTEEIFEAKD